MKRSVGEGILLFAVSLMAFLVMLGHVTALVYIDIGLLALTLFYVYSVRRRQRQPLVMPPRALLWTYGLWAAWGALSICWSTDPRLSLSGWLDEIGYPFIAFLAFYQVAVAARSVGPADKRCADSRWIEWSALAGSMALAILSVTGFHLLAGNLPKPGLLHYYAGVGQASTVALFVMPVFMLMTARRKTTVIGIVGLACALAIGVATLNRFFYLSAVCVLVIGYWPLLKRHRVMAAVIAVVLIVGATVMIVRSSAERDMLLDTASKQTVLADQMANSDIDLQRIVSQDTRPLIWRFYLEQARKRPVLGIGFGKRLPKRTYGAIVPRSLLDVEAQAATHAHNMFLNTLLEVGAIGVLLQCGLFAMMLRTVVVKRGQPWLVCATVALVVGMISKNLTDDFMWQSTMLAFWAYYGWLLGRMDRSARLAPEGQARVEA